jgi:hypothetical protein
MRGPIDEPQRRAAGWIVALAREFAARSRDAQIRLVHEFEAAVRDHVSVLGPVSIEDDDDEQLALGIDGRFQGRLLITSGGSTSWQVIGGAADLVDHYDLVDLFSDLTDAIQEQYPGADDQSGGLAGAAPTSPDPLDSPLTSNERAARLSLGSWSAPGGARPDDGAASGTPPADEETEPASEETEPASLRILRDLHDAGVYSDAEYAAKLAELERPPGG